MKVELEIPEGVAVNLDGKTVEVKGPLGSLKRDFGFMPRINFSMSEGSFAITTEKDGKRDKMYSHTARSHINNLFVGVTKGYRYKLAIVHVHFPMRLSLQGDVFTLENFLGSKTPRKGKKVGDVNVKIESKEVIIEGLNKENVGQTAANLEALARVKSKDRRIFKDGIYIIERGNIHE